MKNKVFVGFSGGVDSSVTAHLLKKKGYEVTAIFMTNIAPNNYAGKCMQEEMERARNVANALNIPFNVINLQTQFEKSVIKEFNNQYLKGNTPNPCVECNKHIKFGLLAQECFNSGADFFATGHYAKIKNGRLYKSKDPDKDQTYFLNRLSSEILERTLFPLADIKKTEVRKIAHELGLPNSNKKDSQKICFLKGQKISELFTSQVGDIVDIDSNEIVGKHDGIFNYTIGQRQGVQIGGLDKPYFVAKKDTEQNIVYVAKGRDNPTLWKHSFIVNDFNFIHTENKLCTKGLKAVIRYHSKEIKTQVKWSEKNDQITGEFILRKPQWAPSTGQSLVLYKGRECIGGGEISKILA